MPIPLEWTMEIPLHFPIVQTGGNTQNIAYYAKLYYFKQDSVTALKSTASKSVAAVQKSLFAPLDIENLGDSEYIFQRSLATNYSFIEGELPDGNSFSGAAIAGANFDAERVVFHTEMVFPHEMTGEFYHEIKMRNGFNLDGNSNQISFLKRDLFCYSRTIQEDVNSTPVKVLDILSYSGMLNRKEGLFILGITQDELLKLQNVTGLNDQHAMYIALENISHIPTIDIDGKSFGKYKLKVFGLDDNGIATTVYPVSDVFVYTNSGFVFCPMV